MKPSWQPDGGTHPYTLGSRWRKQTDPVSRDRHNWGIWHVSCDICRVYTDREFHTLLQMDPSEEVFWVVASSCSPHDATDSHCYKSIKPYQCLRHCLLIQVGSIKLCIFERLSCCQMIGRCLKDFLGGEKYHCILSILICLLYKVQVILYIHIWR